LPGEQSLPNTGEILIQEQPFITLGPGMAQAIKTWMSGNNARGAVRIEIRSTGCCDASLGMRIDSARESDMVVIAEGITFVVDREIHDLAGKIAIACCDEPNRTGFKITSSIPLNEWAGFGICDIMV
jgi:Fe-S cluster assembly iron-binding protein IscA